MGFSKRPLIKKNSDEERIEWNEPLQAGELRKSQIITTFGPGAVVDLEDFSCILASADSWEKAYKDSNPQREIPPNAKIHDGNLERLLGVRYFLAPKTEDNKKNWGKYKLSKDIYAYRFPYVHFCPSCGRLDVYWRLGSSGDDYKTCRHCGKKFSLIPARFVVACVNGHIEDFPFNWWVHHGKTQVDHKLKIRFNNTSGGLDSIIIHCDTCGKERTMEGCMSAKALLGYKCKGKRPWAGKSKEVWETEKECNAGMYALQRGASNVYYSVLRSALTIPECRDSFYQLLDKHPEWIAAYQEIKKIPTASMPVVLGAMDSTIKEYLNKYGLSAVKEKFEKYNTACEANNKDYSYEKLREDEYDAFCGGYNKDKNFRIETSAVPEVFTPFFKKIVKVHKLREVMALVGFRRVLSLDPTEENNQETEKLKAFNRELHPMGYIEPSIKKTEWLPGINLYGEGIFFQLNMETLDKWAAIVRDSDRYRAMYQRIPAGSAMQKVFSEPYVLLHTLSHLLIRQITQECGYSEASIKERIYSTYPGRVKPMAGILLYTSSTASDGSLGGLVRMAETDIIEKVLKNMLDQAKWCSSDPLCIESTTQGYNSLNYAACHACALLPETCCESFNCLLDRVAVVGRHDEAGNISGFFELGDLGSATEDFGAETRLKSGQTPSSLTCVDKGMLLSGEDFNETVWDNLLDMCDDTIEGNLEKELIHRIEKELQGKPLRDEIYSDCQMKSDNKENTLACTLCWPAKKILYFCSSQTSGYHMACQFQGWHCFWGGDPDFPLDEFIRLIVD